MEIEVILTIIQPSSNASATSGLCPNNRERSERSCPNDRKRSERSCPNDLASLVSKFGRLNPAKPRSGPGPHVLVTWVRKVSTAPRRQKLKRPTTQGHEGQNQPASRHNKPEDLKVVLTKRQLIADSLFRVSNVKSLAHHDWVIPCLAVHGCDLRKFFHRVGGGFQQHKLTFLA